MEDARTALDKLNLLLETPEVDLRGLLRLSSAIDRLSSALYREAEHRKEALKIAAERQGPAPTASIVVQDAAVFAIYLDGNYEARQ